MSIATGTGGPRPSPRNRAGSVAVVAVHGAHLESQVGDVSVVAGGEERDRVDRPVAVGIEVADPVVPQDAVVAVERLRPVDELAAAQRVADAGEDFPREIDTVAGAEILDEIVVETEVVQLADLGRELEPVPALRVDELVVAKSAVIDVDPLAAVQDIAAASAPEQVVAGIAEQRVAVIGADDRIVAEKSSAIALKGSPSQSRIASCGVSLSPAIV
jgi:hypothetical protein